MKIKKGNLNFDQTGRAYPDNPHIEENWDCIWENEGKHYKLVGDTNNKEWSEVTQLDILTSHMVPEEYFGREEDPKNAVFGYKTSIVPTDMLDVALALPESKETLEEAAEKYARKQCDDMYDNESLTGASWGWETSLDFIAGAKWAQQQRIDQNTEVPESEHFHKADTIDGQWLSIVKTEREWQEQKLVEIFYHYPNACPRWQYMNGLIHMALGYIELTKEKE